MRVRIRIGAVVTLAVLAASLPLTAIARLAVISDPPHLPVNPLQQIDLTMEF